MHFLLMSVSRFLIRCASSRMTTSPQEGVVDARIIGAEGVVADQVEVGGNPPLPLPLPHGARNRGHAQLRCPGMDLLAPLGPQAGGNDHQGGRDPPLQEEQAQRAQRLDGFAQPHVVGQQQVIPGQQGADPVDLIGEEAGRPLPLPAGDQQVVQGGGERAEQPLPQGWFGCCALRVRILRKRQRDRAPLPARHAPRRLEEGAPRRSHPAGPDRGLRRGG